MVTFDELERSRAEVVLTCSKAVTLNFALFLWNSSKRISSYMET